jgi:hypothetical protein
MIRTVHASAIILLMVLPATQTLSQTASFGATPLTNIKSDAPSFQNDPASKCEAINIEVSVAESCLAQVRALEATNPSPELNMMDARLEQKLTESFNPGGDGPNPSVANAPMMKAAAATSSSLKGDDSDDPPPVAPGALDVTKPPENGVHDEGTNSDDDQPMLQQDADMDDGPPPDIANDDATVPDDPPDGDDPGPPSKPG